MTTSNTTSDDKVGIGTDLGIQRRERPQYGIADITL